MKTTGQELKIWEGIFKSFKETGVRDDVFNGETWIHNSLKRLKELSKKNGKYTESLNQDLLFPVVTASLIARNDHLNIIDFGGGLGITYAQILKSVEGADRIEFHIVEKEAVCRAGSRFFRKNKKVKFSSTLPKIKRADIVHLRSSLQYIEDWRGTLRTLARYKPKFFLCIDLFAGNVPRYVTLQNYYGGKIPCQFLNLRDVLTEMKRLGFEAVFTSPFASTFFGKLSDFPQSNLPAIYRIKNSRNILFFNKHN